MQLFPIKTQIIQANDNLVEILISSIKKQKLELRDLKSRCVIRRENNQL